MFTSSFVAVCPTVNSMACSKSSLLILLACLLPNLFSIKLEELTNRLLTGLKMLNRTLMIGAAKSAIRILFCVAYTFGKTSPNKTNKNVTAIT